MRKLAIAGILLTAALTLAFTGGFDDNTAQAQKLWSDISGYQDWAIAQGSTFMMPGQAPHGRFIVIHANDIALKALDSDGEVMPEGAIFAKDNFDSVKRLEQVTVMAKRNGIWFWAVYDAKGTVEEAGALQDCIACHEGARKDMVFTWSQVSQGRSR